MKVQMKAMAAILAVASVGMLSGCATATRNLDAVVSTHGVLVTSPHQDPAPISLKEAGLVTDAKTMFIPGRFVKGNQDHVTNALYINGKRIDSPYTSNTIVQGFMDAPYGYLTAITRYGVDCNNRPAHTETTAFVKFDWKGKRLGTLSCVPYARNTVFTPQGIWYDIVQADGNSDENWSRIDINGNTITGPRGAGEIAPMPDGSVMYYVEHEASVNKQTFYVWKQGEEVRRMGSTGIHYSRSGYNKSGINAIYINQPTYPASATTGWVLSTSRFDQSGSLGYHGQNLDFAKADTWNNDPADDLFLERPTEFGFIFKHDGNIYAGMAPQLSNFSPNFDKEPFRVQCLAGVGCAAANKKGWNLPDGEPAPAGSTYGQTVPVASAFRGFAYLIRTDKGTILVTHRDLNLEGFTGGWGFVLNNPEAVKTITPDQIATYFDEVGIKPIENFAQGYSPN